MLLFETLSMEKKLKQKVILETDKWGKLILNFEWITMWNMRESNKRSDNWGVRKEILECELMGMHHLSKIERYERILVVTFVDERFVER